MCTICSTFMHFSASLCFSNVIATCDFVACWCEKWRLRLNFVDNLCFDKRFVASLTIGFWWEMSFFYFFQQSWSLALALASNILSSNPSLVLIQYRSVTDGQRIISSLLHVSIATDVNSCQLTHDKNRGYATKQCRLTSDVRANSSW